MPPVICPTLIGREAEIRRLESHLEGVLSGQGRIVFVSGEAGVGKSRLVRDFVELARARGIRTLFGRTSQVGTTVPFRPFAEALHENVSDAEFGDPSIERYRAGLAELLGLAPRVAPDAPKLAAMEGIVRLLRVMARSDGLVVVLEDLQWADPESLAVIEYLSDKLRDVNVLMVATERSDPSSVAGRLVDVLVSRRTAERIQLVTLTLDQGRELAERALGIDSVPQALLDALKNRAGGLPFLVEELLGAYRDAGGPDRRQPEWWLSRRIAEAIPDSHLEIVRERLAGLDDASLSVVFAAAVLGRAFDWKLLAPITEQSESEVLTALRNAVRSELLVAAGEHFTVYEFRHTLAREAVLAEMTSEQRAEVARRAAGAIEDAYPGAPGEWCERAAHLYEEAGDRLAATRLLQESARRALGRMALSSAESALLRARELAEDDHMVWMGVDELLLDVYYLAGKTQGLVERAQRLIDFVLERYEGRLAAKRLAVLHLKVARGALLSGDGELATRHLGAAQELAEEERDGKVLAQVAALRAQAALRDRDLPGAARHASKAADEARRLHLFDTLGESLDALAYTALRSGRVDEAVDALMEMESMTDDRRGAVWRIRALLGLGAIEAMTQGETKRLLEAHGLAIDAGAVSTLATIELELGGAYLDRGDIEPARASLERCLEAARLHGLDVLFPALRSTCTLHALTGDVASLKKINRDAIEAAPDRESAAALIGSGSAVLEVARGEDGSALERLDEAMRTPGDHGWWEGLYVLLQTALRDDDTAVQAVERSAALWHPDNRAYLAYAHAIVGGRRGRSAAAVAAMNDGDLAMTPGWRRHHARRVVADAALSSGWGDPVAWAEEALDFFDSTGLPGLAATCRATLRRAGAPIRRRGRGESPVPPALHRRGVTSREMDVLNLVAERLSNRGIGARLFLSPRTVESHVTNLMRKTGAESRSDLVELGRRHQTQTNHGEPVA